MQNKMTEFDFFEFYSGFVVFSYRPNQKYSYSSLSICPLYRVFNCKKCRLCFGHNRLPATLSRFIPTISPYYSLHPETDTLATMNHLFFQCPKLKTSIQKFELLLAYNFPDHGLWHRSWTAKTSKFIAL